MGEWGFIGGFFNALQTESPMLGRFWLVLMLVFRIVILETVASDMFEDEQEEFTCNTLQPGCKQVCYDLAFPISQYRFWMFHIVFIATPSLLYLIYATHQHHKKANHSSLRKKTSRENREEKTLRALYIITLISRIMAEIGFLFVQWCLYGFKVEAHFPCSRSPCPLTVECYTSRPAEKTIFLLFYFAVGVISPFSSIVELLYSSGKWFCSNQKHLELDDQRLGRDLKTGLPMADSWCHKPPTDALTPTHILGLLTSGNHMIGARFHDEFTRNLG
uniref:Gap junction protein delta 3 n=1 Tax=Neolamprologus brichardi TaxID=32507 RepID=A0A3Q4ID54_NEOBR